MMPEKKEVVMKVYKVRFRGWKLVQIHEYGIVLAANVGECLKKALRHEQFPPNEWEVTGVELVSDSFI